MVILCFKQILKLFYENPRWFVKLFISNKYNTGNNGVDLILIANTNCKPKYNIKTKGIAYCVRVFFKQILKTYLIFFLK